MKSITRLQFCLLPKISFEGNFRGITTTSKSLKFSHLTDQDKQNSSINRNRIGVVGVPTYHGQKRTGVELGPKALRDGSLIETWRKLGADVCDYGNIEITTIEDDEPVCGMLNPRTNAVNAFKISEKVSEIVSDNRMCITIGGDHSLGFGSVHGHAAVNRNIGVIWIDAHADLNTPLSSPSGNFHGMPNSFLIHDIQDYIPLMNQFSNMKSCIDADDIVFIGLRDLDTAEKYFLDKFRIKYFSIHDVDGKGIVAVVKETLEYLNSRVTDTDSGRPLHISIDIDSLDPSAAASTGTPVCGGLTLRELLYTVEEIYRTGQVSAVDLVEVNPKLAPEEAAKTVEAAISVLTKFAGDKRGGNLPSEYVIKKPEDFDLPSRGDEYVEYDQD